MSSIKKLTWRHLKALNELYGTGRTKAIISDHPYVNYLIRVKKVIKPKIGNHKILEAQNPYKAFYEKEFLENFSHYEKFLLESGLENDARRRYNEDDIKALMFIQDNKYELKQNLTTIRTFSTIIFKEKGSKYLEKHDGLLRAVCKLLEINIFPEQDPKNLQWRFVVDCISPAAIVLCENISNLKMPWKAQKNNIELWYVGGNNINNIDNIDPEKLNKPLFYSCDWDYHGLKIYSAIKAKFKLKAKEISLIFPTDTQNNLPVDSPDHNSLWKPDEEFSGLNSEDFDENERTLIQRLINDGRWIEEESNDLYKSLHTQVI